MKQRGKQGSTLIIALFILLASVTLIGTMMQLSSTKSVMAINNKSSLQSFYAAEAGINDAMDALNDNIEYVIANKPATSDATLALPSSGSPNALGDASYFVDFSYPDNETIIVHSTGLTVNGARKKLEAKIKFEVIPAFNFGLLSKEMINLDTGNITFGLDIHGNGGLDFKGNENNYTADNGSIATQSDNPGGYQSNTSFYGKYRPSVYVPTVQSVLGDYYTMATEASDIQPNANESDLSAITNITDPTKDIYLSSSYLSQNTNIIIPVPNGSSGSGSGAAAENANDNSTTNNGNNSNDPITIELADGDHGGRVYYIDSNGAPIIIQGQTTGDIRNCTIIATGDVTFNGATNSNNVDAPAMIDLNILTTGNITHNGSNKTGCFYWLDGQYVQNGASDYLNGRVMSQQEITMKGKFSISSDAPLKDQDEFPHAFIMRSWHEIPADQGFS